MGRHTFSLPDVGSTTLREGDLAHPPKPTPSFAVAPADDVSGARPPSSRALSGGIGLLAQPHSPSKLQQVSDTKSQPVSEAKLQPTSSAKLQPPSTTREDATPSIALSPPPPTTAERGVAFEGGDAPATTSSSSAWPTASSAAQPAASLLFSAPAPNVVHTSSPTLTESKPTTLSLSAPSSGSASPRSPPNLRLEIPPQDQAPNRDGLRAPFAPDPENEGICTEVGSLGQEIQLESGDHLNALERIYLYTQSKATFHRIFMSRALPTYLKEVTPVEAVEYVLPLLGGLAIDEEERVKETFVAELLGIIWWFFTTCRVTDQELDSAPPEPDPDAPPPTEPPLVSVQSFSAVLASLLLSNIPSVSAMARGTVVELLGRTRWIVNHPDQTDVQHTQYSETMRPVGEWSVGLLGPEEARMIQLEIIYGVIVDLGRLDLNAEEYGQEGEGMYDEGQALEEMVGSGAPPSAGSTEHPTFPASDFVNLSMGSLSDSALTPTPVNSRSYADMPTPRSGSAPAGPLGGDIMANGAAMASGSGSSLNLPELSPGDSSSRSSVASPAEPISPPAGIGADYIRNSSLTLPGFESSTIPGFKSSAPSTPGTETDDLELSWHSANSSDADRNEFLRPGIQRGLSTMSAATSGIDPDDYADAEDWDEEGVDMNGVDVNVNANEQGGDEAATEIGDTTVVGEDAYIDDGAAAEEAAIGRVASMSLIAAVTSSGVVDDEIYTLFVEEVMRVSADPVYWVRSETSYALGTLAKAVGEGSVEPFLLPILETLMTDTEAHVRQASVFAIPSVLRRLGPQRRREVAARHMLRLCEDEGENVRTGALQVLAEVIHTFKDDKGGPPEEFLDFFLKGEHNQIRASLPAPTPPPEDIWAEPSSYFPSEPSFPEPDRALICAFNLPAVAQTLGAARWARLSGYYIYLAEESWHTPKVRSTLAASTGEIARIVGPDAAFRDVVPVWWTCVSGGERDAKLKALSALPALLEALDERGRGEIAKKLDEAWASGGSLSGWKERETFAKQLKEAGRMLERQGAILCRIFRSGLEDRVAATREAVVAAVPVLHEVLEKDKAHTRIARDDLFALAASGAYRHKTTFLASCRALVESPKGGWILDDPRLGRSVGPLAAHTVIDVRIGLGRFLTATCERHVPRRNQRPAWLVECLEKLSLDSSPDVRSYVHRATYSDLLELRLPTSASESKPKIEDSEFAEFSRPP